MSDLKPNVPRAATSGRRLLSSASSRLGTPWRCAALVLVLYGMWIGGIFVSHGGPYAFIQPGTRYVQAASAYGVHIPVPVSYRPLDANASVNGSDGQFTYYLALDLDSAKYMMDVPEYRYQRILEPLMVKAISLGVPNLMPWAMMLVGWLAVGGGTWALAAWLRSRGKQPALALFYGLWPGLLVTGRNDLTEGIAYGLVALAVLLVDSSRIGGRPRPLLAALALCLACFARQETAIYAAMMALGIATGVFPTTTAALRPRLLRAATFLTVAVGPFVAYLGFLSVWLKGLHNDVFPPTTVPAPEVLGTVTLLIVPAIAAGLLLRPKSMRLGSRPSWAWSTYCVHVIFLLAFTVVGKFGSTYYSAAFSSNFRYFIPAALGVVLCYGTMAPLTKWRLQGVVACGCLTMVGVPILASVAL